MTTRGSRRPGALTGAGILVVVVIAVIAIAAVFAALDGDTDDVPGAGMSAQDLVDDPESHLGEQVTVHGEVQETIADGVLTVGEPGLLVVGDATVDAAEGEPVSVLGELDRVSHAELTELTSTDLADRLMEGTDDDRLVLRQASITTEPTGVRSAEGLPPGVDESVYTVGDVHDRVSSLLGEEIQVGGELGRGVAEHVAVFDGLRYETDDLLLISEAPSAGVFPLRATARATGTLVEFDIDEAESRFQIELDRELLDEYEGRPAVLAEDIHFFISGTGLATQLGNIFGYPVTVTGEVDAIHTDRLLELTEENVLVLLPEGYEDSPPDEGAVIEATGTAEPYRMGMVDVDPDADIAEGTPVVMAESVEEMAATD